MRRPTHPSFGWVKPFADWLKYHWMGTKMKEQEIKIYFRKQY
jgi:hypothetical protein